MKTALIATFLFLGCFAAPDRLAAQGVPAAAPAAAPVPFNVWFQARVEAAKARLNLSHDQAMVVANGKGIDKQAATPSVDSRSASLVDQSSAPDLISAALNLVPSSSLLGTATPGSGSTTGGTATSGSSGSGSVTATLYALMASARGTGITDPVFYAAHVRARQLSFTAGSSASSQAVDNTTNSAATLGVKYLLINNREIFSPGNRVLRQGLQDQSAVLGGITVTTMTQVRIWISQSLCPGKIHPENLPECIGPDTAFTTDTLPRLPEGFTERVDALISSSLAPADSAFQVQIESDYDIISKAPQVSLAYSTDLRSGTGYSHHRGEFIADFASSKTLSYTVNAGSEFIDRKGMSANSNGGRFAIEGQYQIIRSQATSTRSSLVLSFGGEGDWMSKQKPEYKGQIKTEIPLASGISLPVAYTYENRAAQLDKSNSEAKVGLSIDFAKVIQGLKSAKP